MIAVKVKICGLTRSEDVAAAVAAGADAVGLVFTPRSKRCIEAGTARQLVAEVPAFVSRVGLFMDQGADEVRRVLETVPLNLLQFHGSETAAYCQQFGLPYIKAVSMKEGAGDAGPQWQYPDACALLLDSHEPGGPGGTGHTFDWDSIPAWKQPLVLAGGLTVDNVRQAVVRVSPWAVDVSSGVEDAPGIKNHRKIHDFINEAKREN